MYVSIPVHLIYQPINKLRIAMRTKLFIKLIDVSQHLGFMNLKKLYFCIRTFRQV